MQLSALLALFLRLSYATGLSLEKPKPAGQPQYALQFCYGDFLEMTHSLLSHTKGLICQSTAT